MIIAGGELIKRKRGNESRVSDCCFCLDAVGAAVLGYCRIMNVPSQAAAPLRAGYFFSDDASRRYKGWVLVFPFEMLWESNTPLGEDVEEWVMRTQEQWEPYVTGRSWQKLGVDSYASYYATLAETRAKTSRVLSRAVVKFRYPSTNRRYICGNLLLLQEGWQAGGGYELYAFHSEGTPAGERGFRHVLTAESMMLVCSGSLPTDGGADVP